MQPFQSMCNLLVIISPNEYFRYFKKMTHIFSCAPFNTEYVKQLTPDDPLPPHFVNNPKLWPFFSHALGAIDGSHIHLAATSEHRDACRNRKGFISQNCLFCCSFDLHFTYALTGWEGSASDARLYHEAISDDLDIPYGWYLLADGGFPHCAELLVPYRNVRYHLSEWGRANLRYSIMLFSKDKSKQTEIFIYLGQRIRRNCSI